MLPLVQMHPMVQPQFDYVGRHHQGHLKPDDVAYPYGYHLSQPSPSPQRTDPASRPFALRSAQHVPALHRITTSFSRLHAHDQATHSLRRKTPNGTIDNGYDGSLAHMASDPPPSKHMIVPASSKIFPTAVAQRVPAPSGTGFPQQPPAGAWPYAAANPAGSFELGGKGVSGPPEAPRAWGVAPAQPMLDQGAHEPAANLLHPAAQHNYHAVSGLQPLLAPGYQQALTQPVFSPNGYQQPPVWRDGSFGYRTSIPLANVYTPQNPADNAFMAPQATIHNGLANAPGLGSAPSFGLPLPNHPLDDGLPRYGHNYSAHHAAPAGQNALSMTPSAGYPVNVPAAGDMASPTRFRERALQSAHRSYNDLLLYLASAKRASGCGGFGSRPSPKMVVYPKPSTSTTGNGSKISSLQGSVEPTANVVHQMVQKEMAAQAFARNQAVRDSAAAARMDMLSGHNRHVGPYPTGHQRPYPEMGSPVLNARASLEMLSTLCEQSGWKWIEGMLLGGCLHYGLERYEEALEWFKRILSLDPRWVTFPCLRDDDVVR